MTPFFRFFLTAFYKELKLLQNEIMRSIRNFLLLDFMNSLVRAREISLRQEVLVSVMLDNGLEIGLDGLYRIPALYGQYINVSQSTARRDLKKLAELGLLIRKGKKYRVSLACLQM